MKPHAKNAETATATTAPPVVFLAVRVDVLPPKVTIDHVREYLAAFIEDRHPVLMEHQLDAMGEVKAVVVPGPGVQPAPGPHGLALTVFADIRKALGVGMKPMLAELPGIVRARLEGLETELAEANTKANTLLIGRNNLRDFRETAREYIRALEEDRKESSLAMKVANERIQELEDVAKAAHAHLRRKPDVPTRLAVAMRFAGCPLDKPFPSRGKI